MDTQAEREWLSACTIGGFPQPTFYWLLLNDPLRFVQWDQFTRLERLSWIVTRSRPQGRNSQRRVNWRTYLILKRLLDIFIAGTLLILFAPLMVMIGLAIRLDAPGPAIFAQERVGTKVRGKNNKRSWEIQAFTINKFRTMYQHNDSARHQAFVKALIQKDEQGMAAIQGQAVSGAAKFKIVNDPRITRVGHLLRKTSLDELPQLWNVLKGDMSLIGPRPAIPYEVTMYSPTHLERLAAQPGLTGLWQVTSRSAVDFETMVGLDVSYIEQQSLWLDLKILFGIPAAVLSHKGAI